jgi:hypothetical protein
VFLVIESSEERGYYWKEKKEGKGGMWVVWVK